MDSTAFTKIIETLPIESILWVVLGISVIVFGLYSSILLWHWKIYSTGKFTTISNMFVYLGVGGGFIAIMALSIIWFSVV
jgi:hypothetical protein